MTEKRPLVFGPSGLRELGGGDTLAGDLMAPPWTANTAYTAGALVWQDSKLYRRKATGTSGVTFDPAAWDLIGPSASGGTAGDPDAWLGILLTTTAIGAAGTLSANSSYFVRITRGSPNTLMSKIGLTVGASSGNISVAGHRNTGVGLSATPGTQVATSGSVACPASGYNEIALGASVTASPGDWLAFSASSASATFFAAPVSASASTGGDYLTRHASGHPVPATSASFNSSGRLWLMTGVP